MTKLEATQLVKLLQSAYRRRDGDEFEEDTAALYRSMLADLPADAAKRAVLHLISTQTFRPSIAEIRRAVAELTCPLPAPDEAWGEVKTAIRRYSPYQPGLPEFSELVIERAVRSFGWSELVRSEKPEITRAQWLKLYAELREDEMRKRQSAANVTMIEYAEREALPV